MSASGGHLASRLPCLAGCFGVERVPVRCLEGSHADSVGERCQVVDSCHHAVNLPAYRRRLVLQGSDLPLKGRDGPGISLTLLRQRGHLPLEVASRPVVYHEQGDDCQCCERSYDRCRHTYHFTDRPQCPWCHVASWRNGRSLRISPLWVWLVVRKRHGLPPSFARRCRLTESSMSVITVRTSSSGMYRASVRSSVSSTCGACSLTGVHEM